MRDMTSFLAVLSSTRCTAFDRNRETDPVYRDQRAGFRWWRFGEVRKLFGVRLQILEEAFEFALHGVHFLTHVEDDFHAGEINAEVSGEGEDDFEPLEIAVRVKTRVALGPRRFQQSFALIKPQRLRMDLELFRHGTDRKGFGALIHFRLPIANCRLPVVTQAA